MGATAPIRVAQLSDTHFLGDGEAAEGGGAYDIDEAFAAVRSHLAARGDHDLVVVTGDVADHGRPAQYRRAAAAFSAFDAPVNVCPGNHDQDLALATGLGRPGIGMTRIIEAGSDEAGSGGAGSWCFLFVDSNAGVMVADESGRHVDPVDYGDRLHSNGSLGRREASWIRDSCAATDADHVFIWLHHPPLPPGGTIGGGGGSGDDRYGDEWRSLLSGLPKVRGLGGGHTHVPADYVFEGRRVFVSPALKHNFDLVAKTWLPPGYRTYEFAADGSITGEVHLVDDPRWPRKPLGRALISLLTGKLTFAQFDEIVARKRAEREAEGS